MRATSPELRSRRPAWSFAVALVWAWGWLCVVGAAHAAGADAKPAAHTVVIDGVKFDPEALTVRRGETVVWVNKDPFPHTVTAARVFDSHSIAAGASWKYVARKPGTYAYTCTLHPNMKGTLTVE